MRSMSQSLVASSLMVLMCKMRLQKLSLTVGKEYQIKQIVAVSSSSETCRLNCQHHVLSNDTLTFDGCSGLGLLSVAISINQSLH